MSESRDKLTNSVDEILDVFEWSPLGFREYHDVTEQVHTLQESLLDHLQAFSDPAGYDKNEQAALAYAYSLQRHIEHEFTRLNDIELDDEVLALGSGLAIVVKESGKYGALSIDYDTRLHGKVKRPAVIEAPAIETYSSEGENADTLNQLSAAIELSSVSIENRQDGEPSFTDLPDEMRLFVPMIYTDLKLKRRVDGVPL